MEGMRNFFDMAREPTNGKVAIFTEFTTYIFRNYDLPTSNTESFQNSQFLSTPKFRRFPKNI